MEVTKGGWRKEGDALREKKGRHLEGGREKKAIKVLTNSFKGGKKDTLVETGGHGVSIGCGGEKQNLDKNKSRHKVIGGEEDLEVDIMKGGETAVRKETRRGSRRVGMFSKGVRGGWKGG